MTKIYLGLILIMVYLSGCSKTTDLQDLAVSASPTKTVPSTESIILSQVASPAATETPTGTSVAELLNYSNATQTIEPTTAPEPATPSGACQLDPISQPGWPTDSLQPNELDPETGLHVTGIPQLIDLATYRLKVTGLVDHPLSLTYDDLRCLPKVTAKPDLICFGVFVDKATWTGVPIQDILELAGVQAGAKELELVSADGYEAQLPIVTANGDENFLAYEVNGKPLPVRHGFPLRAVFPYMWGSYWLKWLVEIRIL